MLAHRNLYSTFNNKITSLYVIIMFFFLFDQKQNNACTFPVHVWKKALQEGDYVVLEFYTFLNFRKGRVWIGLFHGKQTQAGTCHLSLVVNHCHLSLPPHVYVRVPSLQRLWSEQRNETDCAWRRAGSQQLPPCHWDWQRSLVKNKFLTQM